MSQTSEARPGRGLRGRAPGLLVLLALLLSAGFWWQQRSSEDNGPGGVARVEAQPGKADEASVADVVAENRGGTGAPLAGQGRTPAELFSHSGTREAASAEGGVAGAGSETGKFSKPVMTPEPLITQAGRQSAMARDGTPLRMELSPGNPASAVEFQAWTNDGSPKADGQYDWRFKIKVPKGGLRGRSDPTVYEAPEDGYTPEFDFNMDQALPASEWRNTFSKSFFVRFEDDTHGLLNVQMVVGGTHFVMVKAWLNPATGSRNLTLPPAAPVKMR